MKLKSFRIKNYRSIVDTHWTKLAPDNITTLIGQNESGKTSVLEGLNSFYNGQINEDILRSDLSLPRISCCFEVSDQELDKILDWQDISEDIANQIRKTNNIILHREWITKNESRFFYGDDEILDTIKASKDESKRLETELVGKAERILSETSRLVENVNQQEKKHNELAHELSIYQAQIQKLEKLLQKTRNERKKESGSKDLNELLKKESQKKLEYDKTETVYNNNNEKLNQLIVKSEYAERFTQSRENYMSTDKEINELKININDLKEKLHFSGDEKMVFQLRNTITSAESQLGELIHVAGEKRSSYLFAKECLHMVTSGHSNGNVEKLAWERVEKEDGEAVLEKAGEWFYQFLPDFKLFEDFSSLLPNRIDLDDILQDNKMVEGYNAAWNFLIVSGLDANFFRESNDRILKQKIENLNGEITLHFQGYWRQNLGKNNKIKLNFELEHYNFNHPEKKGKPYLEFWIKDDHERLYPKQRSRGVRWFLSFYLELKATALEEAQKGKILLIDEPGLSLHSRAQEDVLAVFEDLKEDIQIVYSTHSPHLVNTDKIYRLLAVQRADEYNDRSETRIYDTQSLSQVSGDTLSPIYTLLGSQISESNFIRERNNIIVEDTAAFYYIKTLFELFEPGTKVYFLPSTDVSAVPQLVNLMTGWKLKYGVLLSDTSGTSRITSEIKQQLYNDHEREFEHRIKIMKNVEGPENLFSTIDFKKFVLKKRTGITESNLEFIENNNLNRTDLATSFALYCQNNPITTEDFDEESAEAINAMISKILQLID